MAARAAASRRNRLSKRELTTLVRAHLTVQRQLRYAATSTIGRAWLGLGSWDRADVPRFVELAAPISTAAQRQSIAVTNAYLARARGASAIGLDESRLLAGVRNGANPRDVYARPFVSTWGKLKQGAPHAAAVHAGGARAMAAAAFDVQAAMRDTLVAVGDEAQEIAGYERVANANACEYCQAVDGVRFRSDDPMPLHPNCGCSVEPIFGTELGKSTRPPPEVDVVEHNEMGATLVDSEHDFEAGAEAEGGLYDDIPF